MMSAGEVGEDVQAKDTRATTRTKAARDKATKAKAQPRLGKLARRLSQLPQTKLSRGADLRLRQAQITLLSPTLAKQLRAAMSPTSMLAGQA